MIPTIGRESLTAAVHSVLNQGLSENDFEIVVVNDAGRPLPLQTWHSNPNVQMVQTDRSERCIARNTGASLTAGRYLNFLDDDDLLCPGALVKLKELSENSSAAWIYGVTEITDREGNPVVTLNQRLTGNCFMQVIAGEWIPIQASLIHRDVFFNLGGFDPESLFAEDVSLCRRIAQSHDFLFIEVPVAQVRMGERNSTTDRELQSFRSRCALGSILTRNGAWKRLRQTARSPFWKGKMVRCYAAAALWSLLRGQLCRCVASSCLAAISLLLNLPSIGFPSFWRALLKKYESSSFQGLSPADS